MSEPPSETPASMPSMAGLDIDTDRQQLFDFILAGMAKLLEDIAGPDDAATYISGIASQLGTDLEQKYMAALNVQRFSREQLSAILVDLKNRTNGAFFVIEETADRIVLGNGACPLGNAVRGHTSLCMTTSGVFGLLAANALGYAAIDLQETIAAGASGCRVVIHLSPAGASATAKEYFRDDAAAWI